MKLTFKQIIQSEGDALKSTNLENINNELLNTI
jgi:hypothetical protein